MRTIAVLATVMLLTACQPEVRDAKRAMASALKDPESVQWRDVTAIARNVVCGEVNARNTYGGYTGFKAFMVRDSRLYFSDDVAESADIATCCVVIKAHMEMPNHRDFPAERIHQACSGLPWVPAAF